MHIEILKDAVKGFQIRVVDADGRISAVRALVPTCNLRLEVTFQPVLAHRRKTATIPVCERLRHAFY